MEKKKARSAGRRRICLLSPEARAQKSIAVIGHLDKLAELSEARTVMGYAPLPEEVDLGALWERLLAQGRRLVFPLITGEIGRMDAVRVRDLSTGLVPGAYGILQPSDGPPVDPREIDIVLAPAIAYDLQGQRLGRGGGYYDRFLAGRAPDAFRCGVGFECQVVEKVPSLDHDRPVQAVVTEQGVRRLLPGQNRLSDVV